MNGQPEPSRFERLCVSRLLETRLVVGDPGEEHSLSVAILIAQSFAIIGYYEARMDRPADLLNTLDMLTSHHSPRGRDVEQKFHEIEGGPSFLDGTLSDTKPRERMVPIEREENLNDSRFQEMWERYGSRFPLPVWAAPFNDEDIKPFAVFWFTAGYIEGRLDAELFAVRADRTVLLSLEDDEMPDFVRRVDAVGQCRDFLFKQMEAKTGKSDAKTT